MQKFSLYIHYPFCLSKCPYCDFNSYKITDINQENFLKAYLDELKYYHNFLKNRKIKTIFFGGGTPSIMSIHFLEKILNQINFLWGIDEDIEISMEANPTTFEIKKFQDFKSLGVNRLSIGVQSLNDDELKFFGRIHNREEAINAIKIAEKIFLDKYSIDLICARPNQDFNKWKEELNEAIKLSPFHISLYQLIIEEGTVFYKNKVKTLDDKKSAELYKITNDILEQNNIFAYEVSNYAKNGYECKHNLNYWDSGEWLGIGAGVHSRICFNDYFQDDYKVRTCIENIKFPNKWVENVAKNGCGCENKYELKREEFIEEIILMGLRKINGIFLNKIKDYLKIENVEDILNKKFIEFLKDENFIEVSKDRIKINKDSFIILDSIIEKLT